MKSLGRIFLIAAAGVALASPVLLSREAIARPSEKVLKSDLELEIEGIDPNDPKQKSTPSPKRKVVGEDLDIKAQAAATPRPTPIQPAPTPMPPERVVPAPVVEAFPTPTPMPIMKPIQVEAPRPAPRSEGKPAARVDLESLIQTAQRQIDKKQCEAAISTLRPVVDLLSRTGLLVLAKAYACENDRLNEIKTLELCIAKNPKDYVVYVYYGLALVRSNRVEDALMAFQQARTLNPRYRPAYEAMLMQLEKKGERYESRNVVNDMIKVFGPLPELFTDLCRLYALDDYNEKTVEICESAIDKAPNVPENHMYLGLALKNREQGAKAQKVLNDAARRFPASEPVQWAMGEIYFSNKDFVSAYNYYKKASSADPGSARAWVGYGASAFELQKNDEALQAFIRGCKADRMQTKEFRSALGKLRVRKDGVTQARYEMGLNECQQ